MNHALLTRGAENPDRFLQLFVLHQAWSRLKTYLVVLFAPVAVLAGLYWSVELGDEAGIAEVVLQGLVTAVAGALVFLLLGALLDLVTQTTRVGALLEREIRAYFQTPVPYLVLVLFTFASGYFFYIILSDVPIMSFRPSFQSIASFLVFLIPLLTIRTFAEERARGTVEPLLTTPVSEAQVVAGKFLGALCFYVVMLLPTVAYFVLLKWIGQEIGKPDAGPVIGGYVGMILFGGFHIAIGVFASTLTQDTILGAFLAFVMTLLFWVIEPVMMAKQLVSVPAWTDAARYLSPHHHLEPFLKGLLSPQDALYFITFTLFFLFLSVRFIEYRKWR